MNFSIALKSTIVIAAIFTLVLPMLSSAGIPPRFYWKDLVGVKAVPLIYMNASGNANPLDPTQVIVPEANFSAEIVIGGFATTFPLFDKSAMVAVLLPMGRVSGGASFEGREFTQTASGYADPTVEFVINIIGPPPIKNIPQAIRYEPGFSMDLLFDVIVPIGEYDSDELLNMGQNRWYGRIATPIVWQIGDWVPGRRTTLEVVPSLWAFGDNDDFIGHELSTKAKYQVETHLTMDLHKNFWASVDLNWMKGGQSSLSGIAGEELDMLGLGFTLGYHLNDNVQLTAGYMSTISDSGAGDLQSDAFTISLVFGWHPLVEGMKRLGH